MVFLAAFNVNESAGTVTAAADPAMLAMRPAITAMLAPKIVRRVENLLIIPFLVVLV
jgi:hypothetical protein